MGTRVGVLAVLLFAGCQRDVDVGTRPVQVTVFDSSRPGVATPGVPVVFIDEQQTQVVTTDAHGVAVATVEGGASVSAVTHSGVTRVLTMLSVSPGDEIMLGPSATEDKLGVFTISFTPDPTHYYDGTVWTPCSREGSLGESIAAPVYSSCDSDAALLLYDESANGYSAQTVSFVAGGSATVPSSLVPFGKLTATVANVPAEVASISAEQRLEQAFFGGIPASMSGATRVFTISSVAVASSRLHVGLQLSTAALGSTQDLWLPLAQTPTTVDVNLDHELLPWLGTVTYDPATHTIHVPTFGGGNVAPDLVSASINYATTENFVWIVYAPDFADIVLPTLPDSVGVPADVLDEAPERTHAHAIDADDLDFASAHRRSFHYLTPGATSHSTESPSF